MDAVTAQRVIEELRKGIPPEGFVRYFTVGRTEEIRALTDRLQKAPAGALLLQANYGAGKTHLLRFIRESALDYGFAVSLVTLDAKAGVRFNRMDQIVGALWRCMEIPGAETRGVRAFFNLVCSCIEHDKKGPAGDSFWGRLTNNGKWDFSDVLESPALFVALRAWATGVEDVRDLIEGWFHQPWLYYSQRKILYAALVSDLRRYFRDPRMEWQFYADAIFQFNLQGYAQSWALLRDLNVLASAAGLRGFTLLFDEFEDIITNLSRINFQEAAFWNLFTFCRGVAFPGLTFYAVTPQFSEKCKQRLLERERWDIDLTLFESIPTFRMSSLRNEELSELAMKILEAHGLAYDWEPDLIMKASQLREIVSKAAKEPIEDRTRKTIKIVVEKLDDIFYEANE